MYDAVYMKHPDRQLPGAGGGGGGRQVTGKGDENIQEPVTDSCIPP